MECKLNFLDWHSCCYCYCCCCCQLEQKEKLLPPDWSMPTHEHRSECRNSPKFFDRHYWVDQICRWIEGPSLFLGRSQTTWQVDWEKRRCRCFQISSTADFVVWSVGHIFFDVLLKNFTFSKMIIHNLFWVFVIGISLYLFWFLQMSNNIQPSFQWGTWLIF